MTTLTIVNNPIISQFALTNQSEQIIAESINNPLVEEHEIPISLESTDNTQVVNAYNSNNEYLSIYLLHGDIYAVRMSADGHELSSTQLRTLSQNCL